MPKIGRFLLSFQGLVWTLTVAASLFLCVFPLMRNLWAYWTWEQVPCWAPPENKNFFFELDGVWYLSEVPDFWDRLDVSAGRSVGASVFHTNSTCYVKRGNHVQAVHFLDAHKRLDRAAPRLGIVSLLVVVSIMLTRATRRRPPAAADPVKQT